MDAAAIEAAGRRIAAAGDGPPRTARDPVNLPMIRNWLEAMGDTNPVYERDGVAPPAMTQVWTMRGLRPAAAVQRSRVAEMDGIISGRPCVAKPASVEEITSMIEKQLAGTGQ